MMLSRKLLAAFALAGLAVATARAETVTIGAVSLTIEPPAGYCALGATEAERVLVAELQQTLRPRNELLQVCAPCSQVKELNAGTISRFSRWAIVQVVGTGPDLKPMAGTRAQLISSMAPAVSSGNLNVEAVNASIREKLSRKDCQLTAQKMAVVGSDEKAAYVTMSASFALPNGTPPVPMEMFGAVTLVKQHPLGIFACEKQDAPQGVLPTVVARDYLASVLSKN